LGASGCAGPSINDYAQEKPVLDLKTYFNGVIDAWGVFTDRSGRVVKRFTVVMNCSWNGEQGVLDEDFVYSDGSTQKRIWKLQHLGDGNYSGTADDVVGLAKGASRAAAIAQLSEAGYACLYGEAHQDYPEPAAVCARSFATRACQMDWEVVITSDPVLPDSIDSSGGEFRRDCVGIDRDWPEPIKSAIDNQLAPGPALPAASN
jgi:hypothetical protein